MLKTDSVKMKVNAIVYILLKERKCINFESVVVILILLRDSVKR